MLLHWGGLVVVRVHPHLLDLDVTLHGSQTECPGRRALPLERFTVERGPSVDHERARTLALRNEDARADRRRQRLLARVEGDLETTAAMAKDDLDLLHALVREAARCQPTVFGNAHRALLRGSGDTDVPTVGIERRLERIEDGRGQEQQQRCSHAAEDTRLSAADGG